MALHREFADRIAAIEATGLTIHGHSTVSETPRWLRHVLDNDAIHITNIRGVPVDKSLVVMTLAELEKLVAAAYL